MSLTTEFQPARDEVIIRWRETGGPPRQDTPGQGFGSRLLKQGVAGDLGGTVSLDFAATGLVCEIRAPAGQRLTPRAAA